MASVSDRDTHLLKARTDVDHLLDIQIDAGEKLLKRSIASPEDLQDVYTEFRGWRDYATTLLARLFSTDDLAENFRHASGPLVVGMGFLDDVENFNSQLRGKLDDLKSIRGRLVLYEETSVSPIQTAASTDPAAIFVVHGRDAGAKHEVARFLEKASNCEVIILDEQAGRSKTLIEKLEHYSGVAAAVVILTPDDVGGAKNEELQPRARQNVIFELGFFIGKLGRSSVVVLYDPAVERPSDYEGVEYIKFDELGAWKRRLFKELAALDIPMNPQGL